MRSLGQQGYDKPDQKRSANVYNECSVRKARPHAIADVAAEPESRDRSDESPEADDPVFSHLLSRPDFFSP
jgi:hypothetical protein